MAAATSAAAIIAIPLFMAAPAATPAATAVAAAPAGGAR
jgi:hypothetical protein